MYEKKTSSGRSVCLNNDSIIRRHLCLVTNRDSKMYKPFILIAVGMLLVALSSCSSLKQGLSKAVYMDYDQVNNFRYYEFETSINWGGSMESGINGYESNTFTTGFWVTFVICNLRNEASDAQTFHYDVSNFYVVYDGEKHYYQPMQPNTYSSISHGLPGSSLVNDQVNQQFRDETQIGPDTDVFQKGYYPAVNYRFAIYVIKTSSGPVDISGQLKLRYDGYPTVLSPRNQPPVLHNSISQPAKKSDLQITCRTQAQ